MQTLYVGNENNKVIYFDNFLANPDVLVEAAVQADFIPYPTAAQRKGYPGVRTAAPAAYGELLRNKVIEIVQKEYGVPADCQLSMLQEAMCLMTLPAASLGPLQTIPHFDTSNPYFFATLLYLCGEEHGGTGFYRHNRTGYEAITPERSEGYLDCCYHELNNHRREKRYFSESDQFFTRVGFIPAKFNRLVIYPGCLLHSPNIVSAASINNNPRTGRLTANVFFSFSELACRE